MGLPRWLSGNESTYQCRRCRFYPWVRKIPWRRKWQPTPVFLPGESHGQRSLVGYSPQGQKKVRQDWNDWACAHSQEEFKHLYFEWLSPLVKSQTDCFISRCVSFRESVTHKWRHCPLWTSVVSLSWIWEISAAQNLPFPSRADSLTLPWQEEVYCLTLAHQPWILPRVPNWITPMVYLTMCTWTCNRHHKLHGNRKWIFDFCISPNLFQSSWSVPGTILSLDWRTKNTKFISEIKNCSVVSDSLQPLECSQVGSSVHGVSQVRILEWATYPFSRESSWPRDWTWVSCIAGRFFTVWFSPAFVHCPTSVARTSPSQSIFRTPAISPIFLALTHTTVILSLPSN